ncbi:MAG: hypothetical protein OXR82_18940 [Gammaproteobacteria bacterium]|nr:hypothetical protein [Gammaproteobacteria bacterium]MDE0260448.1 hypothetical protein [Gammaproteobacteria bacterium]
MKLAPLATLMLAVAPLAGQDDNEGFVVYGVGGDDIGVGFMDVPGSYTWGGELGIMRGLYDDSPLLYHEAHVGLRIRDRLFVSVFLGGFSSVFPVVLTEFPDALKYLFFDRRGTGFLLDIGGGMAVGGKYTVMPEAPRSGRHRFSFILAARVRG